MKTKELSLAIGTDEKAALFILTELRKSVKLSKSQLVKLDMVKLKK